MRLEELTPIALLALLLSGCSTRPTPAFASSANESAYAERYPAALLAIRTEFANDETRARQIFGGFSKYPDALSAPDGEQVLAVVQHADAAGKRGSYAQEMDEQGHVTRFFSEEKDGLNQKVGGAAQYAAKQKECNVDVASPAVGALERGVNKALEQRLRDHDEAERYIEDHQDALGKPNLEKLQKQADDIALSSYLVHVRVKQLKLELGRLIDESADVKKTLAQSDADAQGVLANSAASKAAKTTAQTRLTAAKAASTGLDIEVEQAKRAVAEMDARSDKLEQDYAAALDGLVQALKALPKKKP
jgi:PBP1b-binding outer membrane lipoprotein LpoB